MDVNQKSILEMARGAFQERADYEMSRIVDNILDANTKADATRKSTAMGLACRLTTARRAET